MANLVQATDLFLVQRGTDSHSCTGLDLHDSITGGLAVQIAALESDVTTLKAQVLALETEINGGTY